MNPPLKILRPGSSRRKEALTGFRIRHSALRIGWSLLTSAAAGSRRAEDLPERLRANGLLVRLLSQRGHAHRRQSCVIGRELLRQRQLVHALGIHRLLPELRRGAGRQREERAGKQRVRRAVRGQHEGHWLERLADDERHAMLGGLEKQFAVNLRGPARDDD